LRDQISIRTTFSCVTLSNRTTKEFALFKLENESFDSKLITEAIQLGISVFFSDKSKQICLDLNKDDLDCESIIDEFNKEKPVIKFVDKINKDDEDESDYAYYDYNKVIITYF
jgi:hypothetical protein